MPRTAGSQRRSSRRKSISPGRSCLSHRRTSSQSLRRSAQLGALKTNSFFRAASSIGGEKPEQEKIYNFEYGVNIITLDRPLGSWELETVSAPFVKHSHKINVTHPKVSGEFEVKKVVFRTNETGFVRTYINF